MQTAGMVILGTCEGAWAKAQEVMSGYRHILICAERRNPVTVVKLSSSY